MQPRSNAGCRENVSREQLECVRVRAALKAAASAERRLSATVYGFLAGSFAPCPPSSTNTFVVAAEPPLCASAILAYVERVSHCFLLLMVFL